MPSIMPFGPQHPAFPEPWSFVLTLEEENITGAVPKLGFIHRGMELAAQGSDYRHALQTAEHICGLCSFSHTLAYCQGMETLMGLTPPPRARYLRTFWAELQRMQSHLYWLGMLANSLGCESLFMQIFTLRERILELLELTTGARMVLSACAVGGVLRDITPASLELLYSSLEVFQLKFKQVEHRFESDYPLIARLRGKGVLNSDQAYSMGATGPVLRATGISQDVRTSGYAAYNELIFEPKTLTHGDAYDRTRLRITEIFQSLDIIAQLLRKLPDSALMVEPEMIPGGEAFVRIEQPGGELVYYLKVSDGKLERMHVRAAAFANYPALLKIIPGTELCDLPAVIISMGICLSCLER